MPRAAWLLLLIVTACFAVPDYASGDLRCDEGRCPPGYSCGADLRCRKPGPATDAPLALDGAIVDATTADRPPPPDAFFDAMPCTTNDRRCAANVLEVCVSGSYVPSVPSCVSMSQDCFDPAPAGGNDAYCGTCLKGARRCNGQTVQGCPATGLWADETTCGALGCVDPDGPSGGAASCRECTDGERRCSATTLQTCTDGHWVNTSCSGTAGFTCFDPAPAGGSDAYCGACLKNQAVCRGDNLDRCNADGSGYVTIEACAFGCNAAGPSCCAMPTCDAGQVCGQSAANACGRSVSCGPCSGTCCFGGELCCGAGGQCCGTTCCGSTESCCEPGVCSTTACP